MHCDNMCHQLKRGMPLILDHALNLLMLLVKVEIWRAPQSTDRILHNTWPMQDMLHESIHHLYHAVPLGMPQDAPACM